MKVYISVVFGKVFASILCCTKSLKMLELILLSVIVVGIAIAAIAIKMFVKKDGQFTKSCSSVDANGNKTSCGCHGDENQKCENENQ